ncbi:MAG: type II toxin-antitoxin system PemK/MazF family toxin [Microbacterium sp.]|nr:type II toxin-antitoxin system PemK/MazF family toxin [Microbacterium sp.]
MPRPGLLSRLAALFAPRTPSPTRSRGGAHAPSRDGRPDLSPAAGERATVEVRIDAVEDLTITYRPQRNGAPDAGEVVWAWVPYEEDTTEGKDRPVLVIGRAGPQRVYAVKLTSKSHDGERDYVRLGTGAWDAKGRESWVDIDQVYLVHVYGIRREASALDRDRFADVAGELHRRYGRPVEL